MRAQAAAGKPRRFFGEIDVGGAKSLIGPGAMLTLEAVRGTVAVGAIAAV
jgi:hypothetical protein